VEVIRNTLAVSLIELAFCGRNRETRVVFPDDKSLDLIRARSRALITVTSAKVGRADPFLSTVEEPDIAFAAAVHSATPS
jgi:hypothetical protein